VSKDFEHPGAKKLVCQLETTDAPPEVNEGQGWAETDQFSTAVHDLFRPEILPEADFLGAGRTGPEAYLLLAMAAPDVTRRCLRRRGQISESEAHAAITAAGLPA